MTGEWEVHTSGDVRNDYNNMWASVDYQNLNTTVADTDAWKGYVTVGQFQHGRPRGLAWQWRSERTLEGFLYGEVDQQGS